MKNIIEISHLSKSFGEVKAVQDLSFCVKKGELFAFLGINGAGKSTTINIMCGQLSKDSGSIVIDEHEKSEEAESEESEKDEAPAEAVESDAKDSATDELITAFANEPEFSEETATPDEIVANDILKQSFGTDDTYDPMAAAEEPASDSDDSDDDTSENGFVINVHAIKHHITPDEIETTDTDEDMETPANVDAFLNDDDDDEDDNDSHTHHPRFRGFFKK